MGSTRSGTPTFRLAESKKNALLSLLADEDSAVFEAIREEIISYGPTVSTWLQNYALDENPLIRCRTQEIAVHFEQLVADTRFHAFCLNHGETFDLEEASWLLAQTAYPRINSVAYSAILDDYAHDLMQQIDFGAEPEGIVATINHFIFNSLGYRGNEEDYYARENSYLNCVMDNRCGNPISLCIIYLLVCRRLGLPITGIGLPGHFLCRYQNPRQELYIDAFNLGRSLTKTDCMKYLKQSGYEFHEAFLRPTSPRRILLRICSNLHQIHQHKGDSEETARLQGYIVALSK
tara:strand:- start:326 stop:1198 length:873 start_codon:yes stop_codon:yes gene_type:complete